MRAANTSISLWIYPIVKDHQKFSGDKLCFNVIVGGRHADKTTDELEELVEGKIMSEVMDFADVEINGDFRVLSAKLTEEPAGITEVQSPEEKKIEKEKVKVAKEKGMVVSGKKDFTFDKKSVTIQDDGKIEIAVQRLGIKDSIDFPRIWVELEKNFIGKIKPGDRVVLTDDSDNILFEIEGGSFLSAHHGDLKIFDRKKLGKDDPNSLHSSHAVKGGLYVRDDGSLDIGDADRTFYMKIYTKNIVKSAIRLNIKTNELIDRKLLTLKK